MLQSVGLGLMFGGLGGEIASAILGFGRGVGWVVSVAGFILMVLGSMS